MDKNVDDTEEVIENLDDKTEQQPDEEKTFTQSEVNEILKNRLQRERKKIESEQKVTLDEQTTAKEEELSAREIAVDCKEFLLDNGYPMELIDILGADSVEDFEEKVSKVADLFAPRITAPAYDPEPVITHGVRDDIQRAFSPNNRHTPKEYGY